MSKQWFILHALSGHELKVQKNIESRIQQEEMSEYIGDVLIPAETVSEVKQGKKSTKNRKFFPGYVLINIDLFAEDGQVNPESWAFVQNTPSVIGFLGGERPAPLSDQEVDSIVNQLEEKKEVVAPKITFEPGETIKVTDGPFAEFTGFVNEVNEEKQKIKVSVSIFGRPTPIELDFLQVEMEK